MYLHSENTTIITAIFHQRKFHCGSSQISWCKAGCWHINVVSGIDTNDRTWSYFLYFSSSFEEASNPFCLPCTLEHFSLSMLCRKKAEKENAPAIGAGAIMFRSFCIHQLWLEPLSINHQVWQPFGHRRLPDITSSSSQPIMPTLFKFMAPPCQMHTHEPPLVRIIAATFIISPHHASRWSTKHRTKHGKCRPVLETNCLPSVITEQENKKENKLGGLTPPRLD